MTTWPHGDPRDLARAIVADPRFTGTTAGAHQPTLLERLLQWLGELLRPLWVQVGRLLGNAAPWGRVLGILILVAIAVALVLLAVALVRSVQRRAAAVRPAAQPLAEQPTSRALYARALAAARDERWRAASAALLGAALHALDERAVLAFDPARTPGEARSALHDPDFDQLAGEGTWALYARDGATAERFARMHAAYVRFLGEPA